MLTAELVRASRRSGELKLSKLVGKQRERALELCEQLCEVAVAHVGRSREELERALGEVWVDGREQKLADGLRKLLEDACDFGAESELDPPTLRSEVFLAAAAARRADGQLERERVLSAVADARGVTSAQVEGALFADLRGAHVLRAAPTSSPAALLERYDLAQRQAVLLRAVKVVAQVRASDPEVYRRLFRELKFRRLLFRVERAGDAYRLEIDGPFSLFESVTKYGLQLALVLPALEQVDELDLVAELRWGKQRESLKFSHSLRRHEGCAEPAASPLADELRSLLEAVPRLDPAWGVEPTAELLELPGVGLCVPDLRFSHAQRGVVYLELLGFWSRDAVWRRVELVQAGLPYRVLFAVSSRLRVSQEVLEPGSGGALVVFKGALSARAVLEQLRAVTN